MTFELLVKFVAGDKLTLEVDDNMTIREIKEQVISKKDSDASVDSVKLIHKGLNLDNDVTVGSANINASSYLVCVISKISAAPKPAESTPEGKVPEKPKSTPISTPPTTLSSANAELVNDLKSRGYSQSNAEIALRLSHSTLANAVLLLERVPPTLLSRLQPEDPLVQIVLRPEYPQFVSLLKNNDLENAFILLESSSPGITDQLRTRVGDLLELILPASDPYDESSMPQDDLPQIRVEDVMAHIDGLPTAEKREILLDMGFTEDVINSLLTATSSASSRPMSIPHDNGASSTSTSNVQLTNDENQAIERLVEIFCLPRDAVINAFLVCDRNEEYTANYLTENQF